MDICTVYLDFMGARQAKSPKANVYCYLSVYSSFHVGVYCNGAKLSSIDVVLSQTRLPYLLADHPPFDSLSYLYFWKSV